MSAKQEKKLFEVTAKHVSGGIVVESAEARSAEIVGARALALRSLQRVFGSARPAGA